MSEIIYLNIFPLEIYPKTFLSRFPYIILVIPVREEIRVLLEKVRTAKAEEERREAEREIVEKSCEYAKKVADLCEHIAEMYAFAETAWQAKNYTLAADALAKVRELEKELDDVIEEDKAWRAAFWEIMREV